MKTNPRDTKAAIRPLKVVAIGGGTGLSTLLRGLKRFVAGDGSTAQAEFAISDLAGVVTVTDDGGSSGRLRKDFNILPPGDIRNCLVALSEDEALMARLFQYRFPAPSPLEGHTVGNLFLAGLTAVTGDFARAVHSASEVLATRGRIFPATVADVQIEALMQDGQRVRGETCITAHPGRITDVILIPADAPPLPETLEAIAAADLITIGPGSLYTSLVPNVLVRDVARALRETQALRVFVCNLMTQANESLGLTAADHVRALCRHAGGEIFDAAVINTRRVPDEIRAKYALEGASQIVADTDEVAAMGIATVTGDYVELHDGMARHATERLAKALLALASEAAIRGAKPARRRTRERANA